MLRIALVVCLLPAAVFAVPDPPPARVIRAILRAACRAGDRQKLESQLAGLREQLRSDHRPIAEAVVERIPRILDDPTSGARDKLNALINDVEDMM